MFQRFYDEGLAQASFLVGCDRTKQAVVVDPRRDASIYVEAARQAGTGLEPEQKLRAYVRVFLERTAAQASDAWIHQLMLREMADPTPAIELVFEQVIRPRVAYLSEIVAAVLDIDANDVQVLRSVMSIQSQCHAAMPNPLSKRLMHNLAADVTFDDLAEHIAQFSLGGLSAVARQTT